MRARHLRGERPRTRTAREVDVLAAFVEAGSSVSRAAARVGIRPSTVNRHLADLRARSGLTTEQLIYGRAEGWLVIPSLETEQKLDPRSVRPRGHRLLWPRRRRVSRFAGPGTR
jgi:transposase-like protein